jgi:YbgC/YbaW family acyl-CoA thioester hydrolase
MEPTSPPLPTAPFEHRLTVRFHQVDRAGIAFFGRLFEYCHDAFEELLSAAGLDGLLQARRVGLPLVHAEADFAAPLRMGDKLVVAVTVERLGRSSVTFGFALRGDGEDAVRARLRHVHAAVSLPDLTPCPLPAEVATALAAWA